MSCETPQCKRVSTFVEQVYRDEKRYPEPPCTVIDLLPLAPDIQINVHEQGGTLQTLTLKFLKPVRRRRHRLRHGFLFRLDARRSCSCVRHGLSSQKEETPNQVENC
jgi:hypothetical protein